MLAEHVANIHALIEQKDWSSVRQTIASLPEPEIAEMLFELEATERMVLFRLLPREISGEVFALLEKDQQNTLTESPSQEATRRLLSELSPDDRAEFLAELPGNVIQRMLNLLSPQDLKETRQILGYPPESVGRLMTPDYVAVRPEWSIEQALQHVRAKGRDSETIEVLYVVDRHWKLLDAVELRRFILASPSLQVSDLMDHHFIALEATQDREVAVRTMERYDLAVLPVVDTSGVLIGIITFDDVLDVAQEETTEDFHKGAAIAPLKGSYREAGSSCIASALAGCWRWCSPISSLARRLHPLRKRLLPMSRWCSSCPC